MSSEDIEQFTAVTGSSSEAARFYLESSGGNVVAAVDAFFAADGAEQQQQQQQPPQRGVQQADTQPSISEPRAGLESRKPAQRPRPGGKIRGLSDLGGSDLSDDDDTNEYYAGGEKSGQVVKGGDGNGAGKQVDSLFDRMRQAGAEDGTEADLKPSKASSSFQGRGRSLKDDDNKEAGQTQPEPSNPDQPALHVVTFWANDVFTIDDGEPRSVADPANRPFLEAIGRGECPPELAPPNPNMPVHINLVRSGRDYEAPARPRHVAFTGRGQTLAGPESSTAAAAAAPSDVQGSSKSGTQSGPGKIWEGVDDSKPTTSIQLRLADGSRLVARFNHHQTVGDIRRFIAASRPDMSPAYSLMTAFPSAQLTEDSKTISESGLLNAVIIQKL